MPETATTGATPGTNPTGGAPTEVDTTNIPEVVANNEARAHAVIGDSSTTGSAAFLVEKTVEDPNLSALTLCLRTAPVGFFQAVNADLRSVEASARAAQALMEAFNSVGLEVKVMTPAAFKEANEPTPEPAATSTRSSKN